MKTKIPTTAYTVVEEGFLLGKWYNVDSTIPLAEQQAAMFLKEGRIAAPVAEKAKPAPKATTKTPAPKPADETSEKA